MQAQEICGNWYAYENTMIPAGAGTLFLQLAFEQWWTPVVYIIGFVALWFHMNHGFGQCGRASAGTMPHGCPV